MKVQFVYIFPYCPYRYTVAVPDSFIIPGLSMIATPQNESVPESTTHLHRRDEVDPSHNLDIGLGITCSSTTSVGPGFRKQVEKHISQKPTDSKTQQLFHSMRSLWKTNSSQSLQGLLLVSYTGQVSEDICIQQIQLCNQLRSIASNKTLINFKL